jgi:hypothetical protein
MVKFSTQLLTLARGAIFLAVVGISMNQDARAQSYRLTMIEPPQGTDFEGDFPCCGSGALNSTGQVVGTASRKAEKQTQAYFWEDGRAVLLAPLPGDASSTAWSLSDTGVVLGYSGRGRPQRPVLWVRKNDGSFAPPVDLIALTPTDLGWDLSQATTSRLWISPDGRFAGSIGYTPVFDPAVGLNQGSVLFELDPAGAVLSATPMGVLNQTVDGLVVDGELKMTGSTGTQLAARWDDERVTNLHPAGLAGASVGHKINRLNQVVGYLTPAVTTFFRAAYWDEHEGFVDIFNGKTVYDSDARAINDAEYVVGFVNVGTIGAKRPQGYIWHRNSDVKYLTSLISSQDATAVTEVNAAYVINNAGQILATGKRRDGAYALFLMTPEIRPHLEIQIQDRNVVISWPGLAAGFVLESSASATGAWNQVTEAPVTLDDQRLVILPLNPSAQFFRLRQP